MASKSGASRSSGEKALVRQAINGDTNAFGILYTRHMDVIRRYIYSRVGDVALAEDMTEVVFVRAWEALPGYRPGPHPFTSWLYRIAHNLIIDRLRKRSLPTVHLSESTEVEDPSARPEDLAIQQQDAEALVWAIQQLDEEAQQVVLLRFVEGLPHREVAFIIGKSESTSRVIQHRALAALHKILQRGDELNG